MAQRETSTGTESLAATGIKGFDSIVNGGLQRNRVYLVEGDPGAGKTTFGLQFLFEGIQKGESCLYVTLSETEAELRATAESHGWSLDGIKIMELIPSEQSLVPDAQYRMYHPSEVELSETTKTILAEVERTNPSRLIFDSVSEMRMLAQNPFRYRRQILALKHFFTRRTCTVLLLDDKGGQPDSHLMSVCHGVIALDQLAPERRRLRVVKMRGRAYRGGYHDFIIRRGGLEIFPRLVAADDQGDFSLEQVPSGVAELDSLLGGGLARGTSTLIVGPAGSGKSSVALQYASAAALRGEHVAVFTFDESLGVMVARGEGVGIPMRDHFAEGRISVQQVDPGALSPGQFCHAVRRAVEENNARIVIIDSLNGYLHSMPEERFLTIQLHELLMFLGQKEVTTLLIVAQNGVIGSLTSPLDASYLSDAVILIRFFEAAGNVRLAISMTKKRGGPHERHIRELEISSEGIHIGPPLNEFQGVLTGTPILPPTGIISTEGREH